MKIDINGYAIESTPKELQLLRLASKEDRSYAEIQKALQRLPNGNYRTKGAIKVKMYQMGLMG